MAAVRRKKRLWRKAKRGACMEEYCDADKEVKKLIRNAKRKFEKRLADEKSRNSRLLATGETLCTQDFRRATGLDRILAVGKEAESCDKW